MLGLKEEWKGLKGHTKMMVIGGGGVALFFLYTAFKNRNVASTTSTEQTSTQPIDYSSSIDQMLQSEQDNMNQVESLIAQNQQDLQNQINDLNNKYTSTSKPPTTTTTVTPKPPTKAPPKTYPIPDKPKPPVKAPPKTYPIPDKPAPAKPVTINKPPPPKKSTPPLISSLQKTGHYAVPKGGWNKNSVVDLLKANGDNSSLTARKTIASKAGIKNYTGTASQNNALKNSLIKAGLKY